MKGLHPEIRDPYGYLFGKFHPPYRIWRDAGQYIVVALWQMIATKFLRFFGKDYHVSDALVQELHDFLLRGFHTYGETNDVAFEEFWQNEVLPIVRTHRSLVHFIFTKRDDRSRTYARWLVDVVRDKNYAKAMRVIVGEGEDWFGRPQEILVDDNFIEGVSHDWTFLEARWRQMKARSAMLTAHDVMIVGAGYLPELSPIYGGTLPAGQRIVACDSDWRIPRRALEKQYPGLIYFNKEAAAILSEPYNHESFDVITIPGVMSYNLDHFDQIIALALDCLRPGGVLFFDLQLMHIGLIHYHLMIDWGRGDARPMKLLKKNEAIRLATTAAKAHGVTCEYSTSGYYEKTSAVLFELKKPN